MTVVAAVPRDRVASLSMLAGCALGLLACASDQPKADGGGSSGTTGTVSTEGTTSAGPNGTTTMADGTATSTGPATSTGTADEAGTTYTPIYDVGVAATTGTAETTGGSTTGGETIDCDALPAGPLDFVIHGSIAVTEDYALDVDGNAVGVGNGGIFRTPLDGAPVLWVPGVSDFIAGFRYTSDGIVVYNNVTEGTLFRIVGEGAPEPVLSGFNYPNGMDVDLEGFVYVAEESAHRVRRVDPMTGEFTVVAEDLIEPNGISFSPDYHTLYVGNFGGGTITKIELDDDMNATSVGDFYTGIGGGLLDGMAVDACGNVYVCEYVAGTVWRMPPDGASIEAVALLGSAGASWIPNMQFGSGYGGWDRNTLYVTEINGTRVFAIPVGVPDKPRGYP